MTFPRRWNACLALVLLVCSTVDARAAGDGTAALPNVVLIIADDMAWTDYGFMGHPVIKTPNLDRLAARSAVFKRGYVPTSLCRPSLATLISGLYPHQHQICGNDPEPGVDRKQMLKHIERIPTLPRLLASKGYVSFQSGKWWEGAYGLGGFTAGMTHGEPKRGGRHGDEGLKIGREGMQPVLDFIDGAAGKPFFVWYAPMMPHQPHTPPDRLLKKYQASDRPEPLARYYAMCEWFDETCGLLFEDLQQKGLANNTLVVFSADNGWITRTPETQLPAGWRQPFAPRSKNSPYEGGIRTPILVSWPGHIEPGSFAPLASTIDVVPTILQAAGVPRAAEMQGLNLADVAGARGPNRRTAVFGEIFSHDVPDLDSPVRGLQSRWCVDGTWKLIAPADANAPAELYHVADDPYESKNAANENPAKVKELRARLDQWWKPEPLALSSNDAPHVSLPVTTGSPDAAAVYDAERERLRAADEELRFDASLKLSDAEERVAERLREIRNALRKQYQTAKRFPPSEPFDIVKPEIERTDLFQFLKQMPKGGVLHIHTSSTAPAGALLEFAFSEPGCYVCWPENSGENLKGQMGFYTPDQVPAGFRLVADVAKQNPQLKDELRQATLAWNLDLRALKQLAWNSLQYSAMNDAEKRPAIAAWEQSWNSLIATVR